jgi:hypothetical protein
MSENITIKNTFHSSNIETIANESFAFVFIIQLISLHLPTITININRGY